MNESPGLLIQFDPANWTPTVVFPVAESDVETARLQDLANLMIGAIQREDHADGG